MCRVQHAHDWFEDFVSFGRSESAALLQFGVERPALDIFHHHVDGTVGGRPEVVHCNSICVTQSTSGLTFATEATQPVCIVSDFRRKNLDCYAITQQDMAGEVDCA